MKIDRKFNNKNGTERRNLCQTNRLDKPPLVQCFRPEQNAGPIVPISPSYYNNRWAASLSSLNCIINRWTVLEAWTLGRSEKKKS